jgi:hypothetical protein
MKHFNAQFNALTPAMRMKFDNFIYALGVRMLGRTSGMWESVKVGDVYALKMGLYDNVQRDDAGNVVMTTIFGQTEHTDSLTASVAFTALVVNWFWNENADSMSDEAMQQFERVHFGLRDGVRADKPNVKLDKSAYHNLTD